MSTETIVAISTGGTSGGISVIRISGENAKKIIEKIFSNSKKIDHQKIIYGKILKDGKTTVDEVLVSYFKSPNSYTGEDVCEINCHGGRKIAIEVLELVISTKMARLAEPGEFSKRAFINGKMDLSKAEAIIDIINAKTTAQTNIASKQLEGSIREKLLEIKEPLVEMIASIEVGIDYPEYEYDELKINQIESKLKAAMEKVAKLIDTYNNGRYVKNGVNVGIVGSPNSGKSSLLNMLTKSDKAIVTEIEGTTRDVVEEKVILGNLEINLYDTAGIRETEDVVEIIGINKSLKILEGSDIVLLIIDNIKGISEEDKKIIKMLEDKKKEHIVCLNKIDVSREKKGLNELENAVYISAKTGEGAEELERIICEKFNILKYNENEENIIINERHKELLNGASQSIQCALKEINKGSTVELITINITEALNYINCITGESASEDVVNKIFEKFCLGK